MYLRIRPCQIQCFSFQRYHTLLGVTFPKISVTKRYFFIDSNVSYVYIIDNDGIKTISIPT